jgi:hypothetical protein
VTLPRRRWEFHYELQSGSLGTVTPAYDVRVTIAASTGGYTARFTTAPPADVCALIDEVVTRAGGEIAGYVTEAIHRHASAPGDDPASTADTLASCEANIRLQLAIWRTGQDPRDPRPPEAAVADARFYAWQGRPVAELPRVYRIGQEELLRILRHELVAHLSAGEMIAALDQVSAFVFAYNHAILARLEETYRREQETCARTSAAMRRRVLDAIPAGEDLNEPRGEI